MTLKVDQILVMPSYSRIYIVPFLPEFLSRYPEVEIEIDFTDKNVDIVEKGYDLAFCIGDLKSNSLLSRRIADNPCPIVVAPEYLARHGYPKSPIDLAEHICLSEPNWSFHSSSGQVMSVHVGGRVTMNWGDAIGDLLEASMGIGFASLWHAGPSILAGRVILLLGRVDLS